MKNKQIILAFGFFLLFNCNLFLLQTLLFDKSSLLDLLSTAWAAEQPEEESGMGGEEPKFEFASSPNPVGSGARALGMGGAFIGIADDATAASWNPAGLNVLKTPEISFVYEGVFREEANDFGINPEANGDQSISENDVNYFSITYPLSLLDRPAAVSLNYQSLYEFNREWNDLSFDYSEIEPEFGNKIIGHDHVNYKQWGGLSAVGLAFSIMPFKRIPLLTVGVTFNFWDDNLNNDWEEELHVFTRATIKPLDGGIPGDPNMPDSGIPGDPNMPDSGIPGDPNMPDGGIPGDPNMPDGGIPGDPNMPDGGIPGDPNMPDGGIPGDPNMPDGGIPGDPNMPDGGIPGDPNMPDGEMPETLSYYDQTDKYWFSGFNANLGLMWEKYDLGGRDAHLKIGMVVKLPFEADIRHKRVVYQRTVVDDSEDSNEKYESYDETLDMPMSYGIGFSYRFPGRMNKLRIAADFYRTEWDDFILTDASGKQTSLITGKSPEESDIDPTHQVRLGAEYRFESGFLGSGLWVFPVRAGLFYDPAPTQGGTDDYYGATLGFGIIRKHKLLFNELSWAFDIAYQYRFGNDVGTAIAPDYDLKQDVDEHKVYASFIFYLPNLY